MLLCKGSLEPVLVLAYEAYSDRGEWAKYASQARLQRGVEGYPRERIADKRVQQRRN
jgi:hypothetical protein